MNEDTPREDRISFEKIDKLISIILPIPRWWAIVIAVAFVLSSLEIRRTDTGVFAGTFHITGISIALIALIWLPSVLKLIGLTGIGLKTSGIEANTGGLVELLKNLDPIVQQEALPPVIAALEVTENKSLKDQQPRAQEIRQELQQQLASLPTLTKDAQQAREELKNYAREYEQIRRDMPSGSARTIRMTTLVSRIMALAKQARFTSEEIREMFEKGGDGDRIVALALTRAIPDLSNFDIVAQGIGKSKTPFEQYQALRAAQEMLPSLSVEQKRQLESILNYQRGGSEGAYIDRNDLSRWDLSARLLSAMNSEL